MVRYRKQMSRILSDRFTRGFVAGLISAVPLTVFNKLSKYIFDTFSYADFAGIMILGHRPKGLAQLALALGGEFFFVSFLGGVFALLIPTLTSKNLYFKGIIFSYLVWFGSYAITLLYKVPGLETLTLKTAFSNLLGSFLWGILLPLTLSRLDKYYRF